MLIFINMCTEAHTYTHVHASDIKNKSRNGIESHKKKKKEEEGCTLHLNTLNFNTKLVSYQVWFSSHTGDSEMEVKQMLDEIRMRALS